ncbi:MAG: HEAT repeat domain-containing protein [Oscillospiraceae bacterium]|nr:HEAT repeat domain-containing protein [Oscillospiraceae bacterium]
MNLQPLYDVKERLEYAAIAGVSLLGEDFRLQRAAEALKPLAAASPVFGKIDAGLAKLLAAPPEQRSGLLLDVLALVDAVAYTQAKTGVDGGLEPLPVGGGVYRQISYGQISPLLTALTTTGGGRMEIVKSAWENHPEFFEDYRVLPAVIGGLGDSYGEMGELCATLLKELGPSVIPALKQDFDPAGKKEMARRVEVIAALEGKAATPWLREILPDAKKDVRTDVITALGGDGDNVALLLDLAKSERGKNRDAVLEALAKQGGDEVNAFWENELAKNSQAVTFLRTTRADWASDLVARGLWDRVEAAVEQGGQIGKETHADILTWLASAKGKSSPSILDFWRWADAKTEAIGKLQNHTGQPLRLGAQLTELLLDSLCCAGPGPLCELCLELWGKHKTEARWLPHAVVASLLTRSASEVYDEFSPYVPAVKPLLGGAQKQALHNAVLEGLGRLARKEDTGAYLINGVWPTAQPLDKRWIKRLTHAVWKTTGKNGSGSAYAYWEPIEEYDLTLIRLTDPADEETRALLVPYLRERMAENGQPYSYSHYLFRFGGSPRGVLGKAMARNSKSNRLGVLWRLMNDAAQVLPPEETAMLLEEVLSSGGINKEALPTAQKAIPWTIEQLRAGKPFPDWDDWLNLR